MKRRLETIANWFEDRAGIQSAARRFLCEDIPGSSGWRQVFGSVALFLILVQAFTGVLLALNYAPATGEAYNSMRYILTEVTAGRLIRGLHHWGASLFLVVVVMHMIQVFLYGSYKKPRETTWISGVTLFLFALAFGLTGYLLPWDNRAYWGTVVTTRIAGQAPVIGPYIVNFMGAKAAVGAVTFARFYGLHVLVLPAVTVLLVLLHVYLVRRHGVTPTLSDEWLPAKKFYPEQVFKDTVAIFIAFIILFSMAVLAHVPLGQMADPSDSSYIPRPEWYFLFLFQLLKFFNGPLEVVGTVILPGCAVLALILVPFIDRGRMVKITKRVVAFTFVALTLAGWTGLTVAAVATTPPQAAAVDYSVRTPWLQSSPADLAAAATDLLRDAPDYAVRGARVYQEHHCGSCHVINDAGTPVGPSLNGLSSRRSRSWIEEHFAEPGKLSPGTIMPAFKLSRDETANLTAYLLSLERR
jgi:ubiquinol-cytochrome c reductase cytochrome b subunit